MAWVGHVWVDTTVSTVCSAALLGSLVDLDVLDNQVGGVETLGVGVGFGVLEETEQEFGGLDWVTGLVGVKGLACRDQKVSQCYLPMIASPKLMRAKIHGLQKQPA